MRGRPVVALALVLLAPLLAGCSVSNGPDGQSVSGGKSLAYNGASGGQQDTAFTCGSSATVHIDSNLGSGSATVSVRDGANVAVFTKTLNGPGQDSESSPVHGVAGSWSITVVRSGSTYGGFSGQYEIHVAC